MRHMTDDRIRNLIEECKRQEESCLYTSTSFFEWLKDLRFWRVVFVISPIVLSGIATWPLLAKHPDDQWITGVCALLAGMAPAIFKALALDGSLGTLAKQAHQFKILQDRFRQAWRVTALGDFDAFNAEFDQLMNRMDDARAMSTTAPERIFQKAKAKIDKGHYDFAVDQVKAI
jgi:hypothetical protein